MCIMRVIWMHHLLFKEKHTIVSFKANYHCFRYIFTYIRTVLQSNDEIMLVYQTLYNFADFCIVGYYWIGVWQLVWFFKPFLGAYLYGILCDDTIMIGHSIVQAISLQDQIWCFNMVVLYINCCCMVSQKSSSR